MDIILLERIEKLGQMGDVVSVKPGFARNFLLPKGKALRANEANKKHFEAQRAQLEAENLKRKEEAESIAAKMADMKVVLIRQAGDAGQLYGSVTARDVADSVKEAGVTIGRAQVALDKPIKTIGLHDVRVELHPEVIVSVTANVARSQDEAETQEATGAAVMSLAQQEEAEIAAEADAAVEAAAVAAGAIAEQAEDVFEEGAADAAVADAEAAVEDAAADHSEPVPAPAPAAEEASEETPEETEEAK